MSTCLTLDAFLKAPGVILDVRTPSEYHQGRIPGALNLPLFTDEERAIIGTIYKKVGRNEAVEEGLRIVGPQLADFVVKAKSLLQGKSAKVHCWRGGMRSSSMAWLLQTAGIRAITLEGGYKSYRKWALSALNQPRQVCVVGGLTGCGKTAILRALKDQGEQILDLEEIASHRGSSYGMLGMLPQPSNEQFENEIALQWSVSSLNCPLWIEDESRSIGSCRLPDALFKQLGCAPLFVIQRPLQERIAHLVAEYGSADPEALIASTQRLRKRLGGLHTKLAIDRILSRDMPAAIELLLKYYDSTYQHAIERRKQPLVLLQGNHLTPKEWAQRLQMEAIQYAKSSCI